MSSEDTNQEPESPHTEDAPTADQSGRQIPPANLMMLIASLATQALMNLGQIPGEDNKTPPTDFAIAKHYIDLMEVLEAKTKGNLDAQEEKYLQETLHQVRMAFVAIKTGK